MAKVSAVGGRESAGRSWQGVLKNAAGSVSGHMLGMACQEGSSNDHSLRLQKRCFGSHGEPPELLAMQGRKDRKCTRRASIETE